MSYYTNDIDTLRQPISQEHAAAKPGVMGHYGIWDHAVLQSWMSLVVVVGVIIMLRVIKKSVATQQNTLSVSRIDR